MKPKFTLILAFEQPRPENDLADKEPQRGPIFFI